MADKTYRIGELVSLADVTRRTVHYYINKGLLPPAEGSGVLSYYTEDHLNRIILIRKLQESHLPLDEIRKIVTPLNPEQVIKSIESIKEIIHSKSQVTENLPEDIFAQQTTIQQERDYNQAPNTFYERVDLGLQIELHFPAKLKEKKPELVRFIIENTRKIIDNN